MSASQIEIQLIAAITAAACALPGVILVLRRMSMLSDAISHTVLLGIVIGFFITEDLASPLLVFGAAAVGVLTVSLTSLLERTRLFKEDAAIGLVFPALFSIAVLLISRYAGNVHLDTDAVLVGELAFAPFDRFIVFGRDLGPRGLYVMLGILLANLLFITLFYKELKLTTFDAGLAASLGFAPVLLHYILMSLVSLTVVGAFDVVGSILVVALIVTPPAAAYLLTDHLGRMIGLSVLIGALSAIGGYWLASLLDASIAGSMATMAGIIFFLVFLFAPEHGLASAARRRVRQKWDFAQTMLAIHLFNHENTPEYLQESRFEHLHEHLRWDEAFSAQVVKRALDANLIQRRNGALALTTVGRERARTALTH
ncbi:MAG: metal ABC transporter permease [Chloroflexota bacterium]